MILIDDRVGSKELASLLPRTVPSTLTRLQYGDCSWIGEGPDGPVSVGVERKTIHDLVSSMDNGRLQDQLRGMQNCYEARYIVVEGVWRANTMTGVVETLRGREWCDLAHGNQRWMYRRVANYLNRLAIAFSAHVWQTGNWNETALWVAATYNWWQKQWREHKVHGFTVISPPRVQLRQAPLLARIVKEIEDIGWERASEIARHYRSTLDLAMADEKELAKIKGVGKVLAKRIVEQLRGGDG